MVSESWQSHSKIVIPKLWITKTVRPAGTLVETTHVHCRTHLWCDTPDSIIRAGRVAIPELESLVYMLCRLPTWVIPRLSSTLAFVYATFQSGLNHCPCRLHVKHLNRAPNTSPKRQIPSYLKAGMNTEHSIAQTTCKLKTQHRINILLNFLYIYVFNVLVGQYCKVNHCTC